MRTRSVVPVPVLAGLALSLLGGACSIFDPRACSLLPCGPTLVVELAAAPPTSVRVEATDVATNLSRVFECSSSCSTAVWFRDFTPEQVRLRVTTPAGTVEQTVRPSYQTVRPNGPGCGPECRQARVAMPLPGS